MIVEVEVKEIKKWLLNKFDGMSEMFKVKKS